MFVIFCHFASKINNSKNYLPEQQQNMEFYVCMCVLSKV